MSNYRRANTKGGTYFFTVVTYRRQRFLCDDRLRNVLREGIKTTQAIHPFTIDAWVLLPDHLHTIWTLPPDDADFGIRWAMIKRFVTKQCAPELKRDAWMNASKLKRKESTLWQRRFWEHQIRDESDYQKHMDYLHYSPVKHGLVEKVADWPYSTFHRYVRQGVYGVDWAGVIDEQELEGFGESG
jgi:putative transposase